MGDRLWRREPSLPIVIAGATCGDDRLMPEPNARAHIFVTGTMAADELGDVPRPHNPGWILTDFEQPIFGQTNGCVLKRDILEKSIAMRPNCGLSAPQRNLRDALCFRG
ncbi:hypothetical protein [Bradyrhizobium pachyrhizi]|uniref:hypothetical protein n=1 Tax=Bradyrhizobium pachyrhizi TaxID=280333 RepID=UPI0018766EA5|nr:hypothetical protein [Bradyrhizobium pachyrhizi]